MKKINSKVTGVISAIPEAFCAGTTIALGIPVIMAGVTSADVKQIISGGTMVTGGAVASIHAIHKSFRAIFPKKIGELPIMEEEAAEEEVVEEETLNVAEETADDIID